MHTHECLTHTHTKTRGCADDFTYVICAGKLEILNIMVVRLTNNLHIYMQMATPCFLHVLLGVAW